MPKIGIGSSITRAGLVGPSVITSSRTVWAPFDSPGQTGTAYTGQALEFDGVADHIDIGTQTLTGAFTAAFWYKPANQTDEAHAIFGYSSNSDNYIWQNNRIIYLRIAASGSAYSSGTDTLTTDTWAYFVLTRNSDDLCQWYVNGVADGATATQAGNFVVNRIGIANVAADGLEGALSNVQLWESAWSASDVTNAYNNPEELALSNSGTSLAYSDLKLWYPMQDGHRGNQSFLLNGANTGLGPELIDLDGFSSSHDATRVNDTIVFDNVTSTGAQTKINPVAIVDGKVYKITYTVSNYSGSGSIQLSVGNVTTTKKYANGTYTEYEQYTAGLARTYFYAANGGFTGTVSNISVKAVNDKTHGTSVFYGDEQISSANDSTFAGASNWANAAGANAFASYDETTSGQLTVTPDDVSDVQYAFLDGANFDDSPTMVAGRTYRLSYDIHVSAFTKGTLSVGMSTDAVPAIMKVKNDYTATNGSGATATLDFVYVAADHEMITVYAAANTVLTVDFDNISLKEVGFATGWTDTDAQPTIPQLGFQSYNQLGWFDGTADTVDFGSPTVLDNLWDGGGSISFWMFQSTDDSGQILNKQWYISRQGSKLRFYLHYDGGSDVDLYMDSSADLPYGDWVHVVITMDSDAGTNDAAMYLNGVLDKNVNDRDGEDTRTSDASNDFDLQSIEGSLTELSAWDKELSISEVQELYNDGEALDALTHSSATNLAGYWRNEGSVTWTDLSTNSNNGTPASVTEYLLLPKGQNGRDTQGFLMNRFRSSGLNTPISGDVLKHSWILLGSTTTVAAGTAYSVTAWVRPYDYTGSRLGWIGRDAGDYIQIVNATTIRVRQNSGNQDFTVSSMTVGEWVNISVTRTTGNVITVYVDGVINGGASTDTITDADSFQYSYIGSKLQGYPFEGNVDDIAVYTTALSQAQVTRNYKAGKGRHRN